MEHCERCGGFGIIAAYKHIEGGTCFECGGKRTNFSKPEKKGTNPEILKRRKELENERYEMPLEIEARKKVVKAISELYGLEDEDINYARKQKQIIKKMEARYQELTEALGIKSYK